MINMKVANPKVVTKVIMMKEREDSVRSVRQVSDMRRLLVAPLFYIGLGLQRLRGTEPTKY